MRYGDITIYPRVDSLIYKDAKEVHYYEYPRLNESDSQMMRLMPSVVMCTLIVRDMKTYIALKQMDRTQSEANLYIDKFGCETHYYKRVVLEMGEEQAIPSGTMLISATFTALDPHLYDAVTNEVVY